jgi:hypothetical protein
MTKRFILALVLSCSPLWATTYYVDNCVNVGNDLNNGTSTSTPWLTINKVNTSKFNPGDSILFESTCTWREQLTVPSSGSAGNPITFGAYGTGAAPIISGANLFTSWTPSSGSVYYTSYSTAPNQVFEDDGRLTQNKVSTASLTAGQWYLDTANSRIWVYLTAGDSPSGHAMEASQRNGDITNYSGESYITISGLETDKSNSAGIACYPTCVDWTVTGVVAKWNYGDGVSMNAGSGDLVSDSTATYNGLNGFHSYDNPGILFDHLTAYNNCIYSLTGTLYTAGIKFNGDADNGAASQNGTVQYSLAYNNGIEQPSQVGAGIWADTVGNGFVAKYNLVNGNNVDGIVIDADSNETVAYNVSYNNGTAASGQGSGIDIIADWQTSMTGNVVYGNTVWGNYTEGIDFFGPNPAQAAGCTNNVAENNIAMNTLGGPNFLADNGCDNSGTNGSGNVYTYNGFGPASSNFIQWGASTFFSTYSAWETATGNCGTVGCSYSVGSAPTFANATASQFWLTSGSPGIGAGVNLGSPYNIGLLPGSTWTTGVTTGPTNTPPDIGAFVYVPPVAPASSLQAVVH